MRETLKEKDSKAPVGYQQDFVNNVDIFRLDTAIHYTTKVLNTEVKNGKVRIYLNITDDKGKAYVYANQAKFDKIWCLAPGSRKIRYRNFTCNEL